MESEEIARGIRVIYGEELSSNIYLLEDGKKGVLAIDAGAVRVLVSEPSMLVLTHAHFDHTGGVDEGWKNVYLHQDDFREEPFFMVPRNAKRINFGILEWGDFNLEIIHAPGHTLGSICLFERSKGILFSGDTLFADGIGRTDLGGDDKLMGKSLALIEKLPYRLLCPGHGGLLER